MIKDGLVSLWLGTINSEDTFKKMMKSSYTKDGDFIPSKFDDLYNIERYNTSTREISFTQNPVVSLDELLEDFSYDTTLIKEFSKHNLTKMILEYNAVVLLYDFEYTQKNQNN